MTDDADEPVDDFDESIEASLPERVAAIFVLFTMAGSMVFAVWIVVRYWGDVSV